MSELTAISFIVDGEEVESINHSSVPREGEKVEFGARFDDEGNRVDPGISDYDEYFNAEYEHTFEGVVKEVTRHYGRGYNRNELTVDVVVEKEETDERGR